MSMRPEVQEVFDLIVSFFDGNIGEVVKYNPHMSIITENGVHLERQMDEVMGINGDGFVDMMARNLVDFPKDALIVLTNVINVMEETDIPGGRIAGILVGIAGENTFGEDVIIIDGYDRDGNEDHIICMVERNRDGLKVLEVRENDERERQFLTSGIWPWQGS